MNATYRKEMIEAALAANAVQDIVRVEVRRARARNAFPAAAIDAARDARRALLSCGCTQCLAYAGASDVRVAR